VTWSRSGIYLRVVDGGGGKAFYLRYRGIGRERSDCLSRPGYRDRLSAPPKRRDMGPSAAATVRWLGTDAKRVAGEDESADR
jgi:hypothetical protein